MKAVFIDLDGTLLNDEGKVSLENINLLRKANQEGVCTVICTGRPWASTKAIFQVTGQNPVIVCNGALGMDEEGKVLWEHIISSDILKQVMDYLTAQNIEKQVYNKDTIFVEPHHFLGQRLQKINASFSEGEKWKIHYVDPTEDLSQRKDVLKVLVYEKDPKKMKGLRAFLATLPLQGVSSRASFLDITAQEATKGKGVLRMKEHLKDISQVIVVGDQENDRSMFLVADLCVAMGNGSEEIREMAHWIVPSNNHHGVCYLLQRILAQK